MEMDIDASGIAEVNGALRRLNEAIPAATQNMALLAAGMTIESARPTVPRRSGEAARSLRHYLNGAGATAEGGSTVEYYRWLELGGLSGRKHSNRRETVTDGRYIYPGYLRKQAAIQSMMETELSRTVDIAGL